jgi:hypothetical protein
VEISETSAIIAVPLKRARARLNRCIRLVVLGVRIKKLKREDISGPTLRKFGELAPILVVPWGAIFQVVVLAKIQDEKEKEIELDLEIKTGEHEALRWMIKMQRESEEILGVFHVESLLSGSNPKDRSRQ